MQKKYVTEQFLKFVWERAVWTGDKEKQEMQYSRRL